MAIMRHLLKRVVPALLALLLLSVPVVAGQSHAIRVVPDPVSGQPRFEPPVLFIAPGDSVRIVMGGKVFASRLIAGMHPQGAALWWGQVGESVEVTLTEPGVYGHKCGAAYALGLVGLIVVGDPDANLDQARAVQHPPVAARVFDDIFRSIAADRRG
jgi:pseudoazurin